MVDTVAPGGHDSGYALHDSLINNSVVALLPHCPRNKLVTETENQYLVR